MGRTHLDVDGLRLLEDKLIALEGTEGDLFTARVAVSSDALVVVAAVDDGQMETAN